MRNLSSKKWSLLAVLMVSAIANLGGIPPIAAQTNPPESSAQSAELEEAEQLNQQVVQLEKEGKYSEPIPSAERSLAIREKVLGQEHPDVANSLNGLATLYQTQGDISRAIELQNRGNNIQEHNLALILTTGSESQKRAYIATLAGSTDATSRHVQTAPTNPQAARLALTTILRRKGRILDALNVTSCFLLMVN